MFCTKCGKQLHEGDVFCAHCGKKVRENLFYEAGTGASRYEEVVFNPPFRAEAERRTRELTGEEKPYSSEPKKESIKFDWNLDGFPNQDSKKDDDFELNWDAVIEKRRESRPITVEKILPEDAEALLNPEPMGAVGIPAENNTAEPIPAEAYKDEDVLSIEALERELFGTEDFDAANANDMGVTVEYSRNILQEQDKFHTYNAKRDAFQELLDKEKARIEQAESERKAQWEELAPPDEKDYTPKEPPKFEDIFVEPKLSWAAEKEKQEANKVAEVKREQAALKEVAVVVPPPTAVVEAELEADEPIDAEAEIVAAAVTEAVAEAETQAEKKEEKAEETPAETAVEEESVEDKDEEQETAEEKTEEQKEKAKLRYSDIFPVGTFDGNDDDDKKSAKKKDLIVDDDDGDDEGGHRGVKVVATILVVIVAIGAIGFGVKSFFPESGAAKVIGNLTDKVMSIFSGDDEPEVEPYSLPANDTYMNDYIKMYAEDGENIGTIEYNPELKYDLGRDYAFEGIKSSSEFLEGTMGGAGEEATESTYGQEIVKAIIGHYNGWQERNQDDSLIGINSLEIGEIRSDANGYYVFNRVIYRGADGETVTEYQTVRLIHSADGILVDEIKEETL